ncbi:glycosyltransferase family 2 protein [Caulobacter sp. 17J80-11]|uniref:glycosyltransferase family 2 protein n=1 Tax=Caulobacter sp. 17J80-11 TaxID=2763502 RepID=UPI001653B42E|nr:glycosyltransferase [Caulobacter sp. 17J80-11]MBC6982441.1 glycosyltransferase [Caulobacter sp. 17J80-11]
MSYRLIELELTRPLEPVTLGPEEDGAGLIGRFRDRLVGFALLPAAPGATLSVEELTAALDARFGLNALTECLAGELRRGQLAPSIPAPSLTVAICTKDRAARLERLLGTLAPLLAASSGFAAVEGLVIDNAPSDESTREAVARAPGFRYVREPRAGLDFARNAALAAANGDLIAYLDDDVVVDRGWLAGLYEAWSKHPEAGAWTGLVLPFELRTEAQIQFERRGGFGRGFTPRVYRADRLDSRLYPVDAGTFGAGCNMAFDRKWLLGLGGFDEALDTGAPLPGGGDLDAFYRMVRSGRALVYEPAYAVYHQHRETIPQLRRQYWTWGLGFMAFLAKAQRHDPPLKARHAGMLRWWFATAATELLSALRRGRGRETAFAAAELWGGVLGVAGEYDRSLRRVRRIREGVS